MSMQPLAAARTSNRPIDMGEVKKPMQHARIDEDSLSEWELARRTSKTWSMEQD